MNLVFTCREFAGTDLALPPNTLLTGSCIPSGPRGDEPREFPWHRLNANKPLVYASLGSFFCNVRPDLLQLFAEAIHSLDAQLLISAGEWCKSDAARALAGDTLVLPYVPQLSVLQRVTAFISHGGAN